ncbi:MAG TPA: MFS transporter [Candidatus Corynebacterium avicola]|uniref:MFS transporter n=1 Tax=Candidatus Corynebacterium avicola TaxID=2838527 RepID=A0A9D1UN68_9CORY|nr:MFS transporter [Candidatus Corynebacterium avicola]
MTTQATKPSQTTQTTPYPKTPLRKIGPFLLIGNLGFLVTTSVNQNLIQAMLAQIDEDAKVANFTLIAIAGSVTQVIGSVLFGALSDRTTSRFGRRNPWILGGGLAASATIATISLANSYAVILALWIIATFAISAFTAPMVAIIADRVAEDQVARASMFAGIGQVISLLFNGILVSLVITMPRAGLLILAWPIAIAGVLVFFFTKDYQVKEVQASRSFRETVESLRPANSSDLYWAVFGRFLLMLAVHLLFHFQQYMLTDHMGLSVKGAGQAMAVSGLFVGVFGGASGIASGILSDRMGRRKPFLYFASAVLVMGYLPLMFSTNQMAFYLWAACSALAFGVVMSVDQALLVDILPNKDNGGRDLGILNVANPASSILSPAVAGFLIGMSGYPAMFLAAIIFAVVAAFCIVPIKSAR